MQTSDIIFKRHRFPPQIIAHAVWLYLRFNLSLREVEEMLLERGIDVSYETVRRWIAKFGLPLSGGPVSVLVHCGSWRYSWGGRRSGSGWRSRPLDGLGSWRAIPQ